MPIIAILFIVIIFWLWNLSEENKRKNERDQVSRTQINEVLPQIRSAEIKFSSRINNFSAGYFTHYELNCWKRTVNELSEIVSKTIFENIGLDNNDVLLIRRFQEYYSKSDIIRNDYNDNFIDHELLHFRSFFDNVEGRMLDDQQRVAIIKDEDNNIVIAGAGSGKTTTIVGKVNYITDRYKTDPAEILLISFTNKSASTLAKRIAIPRIEVKTFHKFSLEVIADTEERKPSIFDEEQFTPLITSFFQKLLKGAAYLKKTTSFFSHFLKPPKPQNEFNDQGEYFQYLKDLNFSSYKLLKFQFRGKETFKREIVKSVEECTIANFLLFNNVEYAYEAPYAFDTSSKDHRQYKPDFTITSGDTIIYLEHFAINKNGQVPHFFADAEIGETIEQATKKYVDGINWKREIHAQHETCMIESYSHEIYDDTLLEKLHQKLTAAGVILIPKTPAEIWDIIVKAAKDEVEGVVRLIQTFITLMKSNNFSISDVQNKNDATPDTFNKKRNKLFLEIVGPVYEHYQNYLAERKEIDFSDMINKATQYIISGKYKRKLKYIIIDEFQDISIGRYQLLKALKKTNPRCKLFCVGDDWQSIYRFTGSDISLFKDFGNYFGATETSKIETTYRFKNPLLGVSSKFILKNPNQTRKQLRSIQHSASSIHKIIYSNSEFSDDTESLIGIFDELKKMKGIDSKEILILGRYTLDLKRIKNPDKVFNIDAENQTLSYGAIKARFMTIHKSKGLEADIVIVINCNAGKYGFPSGISDDSVLNLLLSEADQFENGEERRLFYVALTRAKEIVYLVTDNFNKSKFITELETESDNNSMKKCPRCVTADLTKRTGITNGKNWAFWGCTNYQYGCEYVEWIN
jgi:DNA helicase IV